MTISDPLDSETRALLLHPHVAIEACYAVRLNLDPLRFGILSSELTLPDILAQPYTKRKDIVEKGPYIDIYLGRTRVYKRVATVLLYAFCPDIGRYIEPHMKRFIVRLPHGFSNVLAVKFAVLYMEEYTLHPRFRTAEWKVRGDVATYICLVDLFEYMGMGEAAEKLEVAILRRLREFPLRLEQIRAIWGRENYAYPSRWAEAMADSIVTFLCVPKLEAFVAKLYGGAEENKYEDVIATKLNAMAKTYQGYKDNPQ